MKNFKIKSCNSIFFLITVILLISCSNEVRQKHQELSSDLKKFKLVSEIKSDPESPFYIDFNRYPSQRKSLPIGIFDSGTGGFSVLNAIIKLDEFENHTREPGSDGIPDFISEKFIYLGDKANMPYGLYPSEGKTDFLQELIIKDIRFLLSDQYYLSPEEKVPQGEKSPVKAVVIACNTATAFGFELIQKVLKEWDLNIKVMGIIDAGAKQAAQSYDCDKDGVVGVLATQGTCESKGYIKALEKHCSEKDRHKMTVVQQPCFGLAGAVDGDPAYIVHEPTGVRGSGLYQGPEINHRKYPIDLSLWKEYNFGEQDGLLVKKDKKGRLVEVEINSIENYIKYYVTTLVIKVLNEKAGPLCSVILGCTHYALFQEEFKDHFLYLRTVDKKYKDIISKNLKIIDPAQAEAVSLYKHLRENNLFAHHHNKESRFFISLPNTLLKTNQIDLKGEFPFDYKYGRFINQSQLYVKRIPLKKEMLSIDILFNLKNNWVDLYQLLFGLE